MTENVSRTRDDLVARLRRAGELQVSGDNQAERDSYFDTRQFRFHGSAEHSRSHLILRCRGDGIP